MRANLRETLNSKMERKQKALQEIAQKTSQDQSQDLSYADVIADIFDSLKTSAEEVEEIKKFAALLKRVDDQEAASVKPSEEIKEFNIEGGYEVLNIQDIQLESQLESLRNWRSYVENVDLDLLLGFPDNISKMIDEISVLSALELRLRGLDRVTSSEIKERDEEKGIEETNKHIKNSRSALEQNLAKLKEDLALLANYRGSRLLSTTQRDLRSTATALQAIALTTTLTHLSEQEIADSIIKKTAEFVSTKAPLNKEQRMLILKNLMLAACALSGTSKQLTTQAMRVIDNEFTRQLFTVEELDSTLLPDPEQNSIAKTYEFLKSGYSEAFVNFNDRISLPPLDLKNTAAAFYQRIRDLALYMSTFRNNISDISIPDFTGLRAPTWNQCARIIGRSVRILLEHGIVNDPEIYDRIDNFLDQMSKPKPRMALANFTEAGLGFFPDASNYITDCYGISWITLGTMQIPVRIVEEGGVRKFVVARGETSQCQVIIASPHPDLNLPEENVHRTQVGDRDKAYSATKFLEALANQYQDRETEERILPGFTPNKYAISIGNFLKEIIDSKVTDLNILLYVSPSKSRTDILDKEVFKNLERFLVCLSKEQSNGGLGIIITSRNATLITRNEEEVKRGAEHISGNFYVKLGNAAVPVYVENGKIICLYRGAPLRTATQDDPDLELPNQVILDYTHDINSSSRRISRGKNDFLRAINLITEAEKEEERNKSRAAKTRPQGKAAKKQLTAFQNSIFSGMIASISNSLDEFARIQPGLSISDFEEDIMNALFERKKLISPTAAIIRKNLISYLSNSEENNPNSVLLNPDGAFNANIQVTISKEIITFYEAMKLFAALEVQLPLLTQEESKSAYSGESQEADSQSLMDKILPRSTEVAAEVSGAQRTSIITSLRSAITRVEEPYLANLSKDEFKLLITSALTDSHLNIDEIIYSIPADLASIDAKAELRKLALNPESEGFCSGLNKIRQILGFDGSGADGFGNNEELRQAYIAFAAVYFKNCETGLHINKEFSAQYREQLPSDQLNAALTNIPADDIRNEILPPDLPSTTVREQRGIFGRFPNFLSPQTGRG